MVLDATRLFVCDCEKTMVLNPEKLGGSHANVSAHHHLCRSEINVLEAALATDSPICISCTQERPLFEEIAAESGHGAVSFVNIREMAGWTADTASTAPKMAALLAAAKLPVTPARLRAIESDGLCLVIGSGQAAFDTAQRLNRTLSVTLLLTRNDDLVLPSELQFPVFAGRVAAAAGSLGAFELVVDGYAAMLPSSRARPEFAMPRDGAKTTCSVIFDMSSDTSLFTRAHGRDGYFRADPGNPVAVLEAVLEAADYSGSFEKPLYVTYDASICAHERSRKTGCTKCIDQCPAGAITGDGDVIVVDSGICGGCGNCAAHCPTGAVAYAYPRRTDQISRVQTLARTYLAAGGKAPVLLLHDASHGTPLIGAMARFGRGLPARVIPLEMHATSGVGHDLMSAALAAGFRQIVVLGDPHKTEEFGAVGEEGALTEALLSGFGQKAGRIVTLLEADPDQVETALYTLPDLPEISRAAPVPLGGKREVARAALLVLADAGKPASTIVPLAANAPYGTVHVDTAACTLCMACVSCCPADALRDTPDTPELRFVESACVQCGICEATCPETAITLEPRYNLAASVMQPVTLHADEPACCTSCGKAFAAGGMLRAVERRLEGNWMFDSDERRALIHMCEGCRLEALSRDGADPFAIAHQRRTRTTEDYLEAGRQGLTVDDFLSKE
ncbi:4Fe-4S dicluster domain [Hoeflea sp. IMCC20628]|uniref:4Fe-4S dicluster domain-containing protein n=1 Tax=Hoeflea sp. IMCC20628 TaxID=1620421 RepID=UPI00063A9335|nr:4Fe-4S dicluster domain-containing protein [Hoeflea sp. IMCC20628]AKI01993.1 4Fe-4S dicluster domain [Hoeflea sp. IMCC20628]